MTTNQNIQCRVLHGGRLGIVTITANHGDTVDVRFTPDDEASDASDERWTRSYLRTATNTGGTMNPENITEDQLVAWCGEAYAMGRDAGIAAASWCFDGNSDPAERARVLAMLRDGDPEAFDYLPREPNLSGEFADDPTPLSVARDVTGEDDPTPAIQDDLAEAWERGACDVFGAECERLLAEFCGDVIA